VAHETRQPLRRDNGSRKIETPSRVARELAQRGSRVLRLLGQLVARDAGEAVPRMRALGG